MAASLRGKGAPTRAIQYFPMGYETKTQVAVRALREKIQSGEIAPGERLRVQALTDELDMSATPIREALRLLESDGLIVYRPHLGIEVAQLLPEEVAEIYMLRQILESLAVQLAVPVLDAAALDELDRLHRQVVQAAAAHVGISEANAAWHWAIYDQAKRPYLQEFIRRLWERFPWRTTWVLPQRSERTEREHAMIMEAVHAGDAQLAADRMRSHIAQGRESTFSRSLLVPRVDGRSLTDDRRADEPEGAAAMYWP